MSMAWVAVGTTVAGVAGAVASSQANASGIRRAGNTAAATAAMQDATQREMFYRMLQENAPFRSAGLSALPQLQSAILGGPVQYADPNYRQMSPEEVARHRAQQVLTRLNAGEIQVTNEDYWRDVGHGEDALSRIARDPNMLRQFATDQSDQLYMAPDGTVVATPPMRTANYDYQASPSLAPQTRALNRALASRGISGGGQAGTGRADLAANDYDRQLSRLSGLVGMGQGAANSNVGAMANLGNNLADIQGNLGNTQAALALQQGQNRASLYSGLAGLVGNGANTFAMGRMMGAGNANNANSASSGGGGGGYPNTNNWFIGNR